MMATQSVTIPASGQSAQTSAAACGCGAPLGSCCDLTCLVQPRFFCGQLLTDQDLGALLAWTKGRLALGRYRLGWGVVCGLEVRCDPDPAQTSQLRVGPGYAVNCCGDDILVCEDTSLSLAPICQQDKDPCAGLRRASEAQPGNPVGFGGISVQENELRTVDLYINYHEEQGEPVTALGRGTCTSAAPCEYSRIHERFVLTPRLAVRDADPRSAAAESWRAEYDKCLDVIAQFVREGLQDGRPDDVRRWLLRWLDDHRLQQFAFVRDWIWDQQIELTEAVATQILFWIAQDCRNAFLQESCYACRDDPGVPLARISLHSTVDAAGKRTCDILEIDSYPPYRRPLRAERWPAPLGEVNLLRAIWHKVDDARALLAALGVTATPEPFAIPHSANALAEQLRGGLLSVKGGSSCRMQVFDDERVVGFTSGA
jgi:hypothetical protein